MSKINNLMAVVVGALALYVIRQNRAQERQFLEIEDLHCALIEKGEQLKESRYELNTLTANKSGFNQTYNQIQPEYKNERILSCSSCRSKWRA